MYGLVQRAPRKYSNQTRGWDAVGLLEIHDRGQGHGAKVPFRTAGRVAQGFEIFLQSNNGRTAVALTQQADSGGFHGGTGTVAADVQGLHGLGTRDAVYGQVMGCLEVAYICVCHRAEVPIDRQVVSVCDKQLLQAGHGRAVAAETQHQNVGEFRGRTVSASRLGAHGRAQLFPRQRADDAVLGESVMTLERLYCQ